MMRKMIIIQFAFEALLTAITIPLQVHARSVKVMFNTGTGKHKSNKKAAVDYVYGILDTHAKAKLDAFRKKDDVCDAILQAIYVGSHAETLLVKRTAARFPKAKKKKKRTSGQKRTAPAAPPKKRKRTL